MLMGTLGSMVLVVVLAVATWSDVRTRRIPNVLTLSAFVFALVVRSVAGLDVLADGLLGAGLALCLLLPLFAMGGVGGGDAKLLTAVGAFLGVHGLLVALLATAIAGGVLALVFAVRRGVILPVLLNTGGLMKYVFTLGRAGERVQLQVPGTLSVPYGAAIAAGACFALWYGGGL
jgi:prepilin peptidase CpaA